MRTRLFLTALSGVVLLSLPMVAMAFGEKNPTPDKRPVATAARTWQPDLFNTAATKKAENETAKFTVPFSDNFQDGDASNANYTFIDVDNDGVVVGPSETYNKWFWKEDERLMQYCVNRSDRKPGNDWLMTPAIHLDGKTTYILEYIINMGAESNLRVTIGKTLDPADHKEIDDLNKIYDTWMTAHTVEFTVEGEGDYYIGFQNYSAESSFYFNLFSIDLKAGTSAFVPTAPESLTAVPDELGNQGATVKFIAPKKYANGDQITSQLDVNIFRNDKLAHTMACTPGEECSWHDDAPAMGDNTYRVVGVIEGEEGLSAEVKTWVGADIPKAASLKELRTINGNMNVVVSWDAVTEGQHGADAYFNPEEVTYIVYRGYDRNSMAPIATGLRELTYTDTEIGEILKDYQEGYFYGVAAATEAGAALSAARIIAVGKPYEFPQQESFPEGRFNIYPWLTDPIEGSFSWECIRDENGFAGQDSGKGFSKFYNYWGGVADSRLKSPVFTLKGTKNPMFCLWMYHWDENSVAADNGATRLIVEASVDGGEWKALGDPLLAGYKTEGWMEHQFLLNDFANAETIQFGLRGQTDNNWMYYYIDNLHFEELKEYDLGITSFYGDPTATIGGTAAFRVDYQNRGSKTAKDYTVNLYLDGKLLKTTNGQELASGESSYKIFAVDINASMAGENAFTVKLDYNADGNQGNNVSDKFTTTVAKSTYPTVANLKGELVATGHAVLTWDAPQLPERGSTIVDGAEDHESFAISEIGNWLTVDADKLGSGRIVDEDIPAWPNCETNQAFMVWCPDDITSKVIEKYPSLAPYEGDKCFISWCANIFDDWWTEPKNDDYLISSEVTPGTTVKFMVKGGSSTAYDETFEVMYSSTNRSIDSFTTIYSGVATEKWEQIEVKLPEDARYFCIHYTASFQLALMVDNIEYSPIDGCLKLMGYDVFRNNEKLNDKLLTEPRFDDTTIPDGDNFYSVAAVYDLGTSNACTGIKVIGTTGIGNVESAEGPAISASKGSVTISSTETVNVTVCRIDGVIVYNGTITGSKTIDLASGVYIVKAADKVCKVAL